MVEAALVLLVMGHSVSIILIPGLIGSCLLGRLVAGDGLVRGLRPLGGDALVGEGAARPRGVGDEDFGEPISKLFFDSLSLMLPNTDRLVDIAVWVRGQVVVVVVEKECMMLCPAEDFMCCLYTSKLFARVARGGGC